MLLINSQLLKLGKKIPVKLIKIVYLFKHFKEDSPFWLEADIQLALPCPVYTPSHTLSSKVGHWMLCWGRGEHGQRRVREAEILNRFVPTILLLPFASHFVVVVDVVFAVFGVFFFIVLLSV